MKKPAYFIALRSSNKASALARTNAALFLEKHIQESMDSPEQKEEGKKRKKTIHND